MRKKNSNLPPKLAQPALRALASVGVTRLEQLAGFSEAEIKALHGMGPNGLALLHAALEARGLSFANKEK